MTHFQMWICDPGLLQGTNEKESEGEAVQVLRHPIILAASQTLGKNGVWALPHPTHIC